MGGGKVLECSPTDFGDICLLENKMIARLWGEFDLEVPPLNRDEVQFQRQPAGGALLPSMESLW